MRQYRKDELMFDTKSNDIFDQAMNRHQTLLDSIKMKVTSDDDTEKIRADIHSMIDKSIDYMKQCRQSSEKIEEIKMDLKAKEASVRKLNRKKMAELEKMSILMQRGPKVEVDLCHQLIQTIDEEYDQLRRRDFLYLTRWMDSRPGYATSNRDEIGTESCAYIGFFADHGPKRSITHTCITAFQSYHSACSQYAKIIKDIEDGEDDRAATLFELSYDSFTRMALQDGRDLVKAIARKTEQLELEQTMGTVMGSTTPGKKKVQLLPEMYEFLKPMKTNLDELNILYDEITKEVKPARMEEFSSAVGAGADGTRSASSGLFRASLMPVLDRINALMKPAAEDSGAEQMQLPATTSSAPRPPTRRGGFSIMNFMSAPNMQQPKTPTPEEQLHDAITHHDVPKFFSLVEEPGVDINAPNLNKWSPLHTACHLGHIDIALALVRRGANPAILNTMATLPLHYLCSHAMGNGDREDFFRLLHRLGKATGVNVRNSAGETPLFFAIRGECDRNLVKFLLSHGGDCTLEATNGKTALDIAKSMNRPEGIVRLLEVEMEKRRSAVKQGRDSLSFVCHCEEKCLPAQDGDAQIILRVWSTDQTSTSRRIKNHRVKTFMLFPSTTARTLRDLAAKKLGLAEQDVDIMIVYKASNDESTTCNMDGCRLRPVEDEELLFNHFAEMEKRQKLQVATPRRIGIRQEVAHPLPLQEDSPIVGKRLVQGEEGSVDGGTRSMPGGPVQAGEAGGTDGSAGGAEARQLDSVLGDGGEGLGTAEGLPACADEEGDDIVLGDAPTMETVEDGDVVFLLFGDTFLNIEIILRDDLENELLRDIETWNQQDMEESPATTSTVTASGEGKQGGRYRVGRRGENEDMVSPPTPPTSPTTAPLVEAAGQGETVRGAKAADGHGQRRRVQQRMDSYSSRDARGRREPERHEQRLRSQSEIPLVDKSATGEASGPTQLCDRQPSSSHLVLPARAMIKTKGDASLPAGSRSPSPPSRVAAIEAKKPSLSTSREYSHEVQPTIPEFRRSAAIGGARGHSLVNGWPMRRIVGQGDAGQAGRLVHESFQARVMEDYSYMEDSEALAPATSSAGFLQFQYDDNACEPDVIIVENICEMAISVGNPRILSIHILKSNRTYCYEFLQVNAQNSYQLASAIVNILHTGDIGG
eukprot:CAMPEP_0119129532 /NCGR_PEP_ID=MMETSP1310-20130426/7238_1 /TAXON_ID=464262 /ORGANISM="Genus nov. species nov., Strain RCC2339" /LENGTH=1155 /DNA_ID=CAMNT_0007119959 /DNA_START=114 /DNA_END=3581 /DNA_ORIENTATION=-